MKDRVVVGSLGGIIGSLIYTLIGLVINAVGIASLRLLFLDAQVFLPPQIAQTTAGNAFGFVVHLLLGAIIGILYMHVLPYTGDDYLFYKGILLGAIAWLFLGGILGNMLRLPIKDTLLDASIAVVLNLIFGLATVYSIKRLWKKKIY